MSFYGPKVKKRGFDELVLSETWFQFGDGRVLALRRMKIDASPAVYGALEQAIDEAGDPAKIDGLVELARLFCFAPRPSLFIRARRLFGLGDFSEATIRRRLIPMADKVKFEKWLIEENRDIDIEGYQKTKLAEVKKNLQFGFAEEMARYKVLGKTFPLEILERLRSFYLQEASMVLGVPSASRRSKSGG